MSYEHKEMKENEEKSEMRSRSCFPDVYSSATSDYLKLHFEQQETHHWIDLRLPEHSTTPSD